jgi:hypothetical protein
MGRALLATMLLTCIIIVYGCDTDRGTINHPPLGNSNQGSITCIKPPSNILTTGLEAKLDASVYKLGQIAKASISANEKAEKIRETVPEVQSFEILDYHFCTMYHNQVITNKEYLALVQQVLPRVSNPSGAPPQPPKAPTVSLAANPMTIHKGQSSELSWSAENATEVQIDGTTVGVSGKRIVSPTDTATYRILARGLGGTKEATAQVVVIPLPKITAFILYIGTTWDDKDREITFHYTIHRQGDGKQVGGISVGGGEVWPDPSNQKPHWRSFTIPINTNDRFTMEDRFAYRLHVRYESSNGDPRWNGRLRLDAILEGGETPRSVLAETSDFDMGHHDSFKKRENVERDFDINQ